MCQLVLHPLPIACSQRFKGKSNVTLFSHPDPHILQFCRRVYPSYPLSWGCKCKELQIHLFLFYQLLPMVLVGQLCCTLHPPLLTVGITFFLLKYIAANACPLCRWSVSQVTDTIDDPRCQSQLLHPLWCMLTLSPFIKCLAFFLNKLEASDWTRWRP